MKKYLTTLLTEKGKNLDDELQIDGHFGLTFKMLFDFIESLPEYHANIKKMLVQIDFKNGDVFHYFDHLAQGMIASVGH
jgi:hypothetical protein